MADARQVAGAALAGLAGHGVLSAVLVAAGAASVRVGTPRLVLVPLAGVAAAALLASAPSTAGSRLLAVAGAWFVAGVVHHYAVGITPQWGSRPVHGLAHLTWDLAFHAPPLLLGALGVREAGPGPHPARATGGR